MPYTRANVKLTFKPSAFFDDLEKLSKMKRRTLQASYYRAIRQGLVTIESGQPHISEEGLRLLRPFKPLKLTQSKLMVIFDIAERDRFKRQQLRLLLRELRFTQVQRSVWQSSFDSRDHLLEAIQQLGLSDEVLIYEVSPIKTST